STLGSLANAALSSMAAQMSLRRIGLEGGVTSGSFVSRTNGADGLMGGSSSTPEASVWVGLWHTLQAFGESIVLRTPASVMLVKSTPGGTSMSAIFMRPPLTSSPSSIRLMLGSPMLNPLGCVHRVNDGRKRPLEVGQLKITRGKLQLLVTH